jgi:hypothetical protein
VQGGLPLSFRLLCLHCLSVGSCHGARLHSAEELLRGLSAVVCFCWGLRRTDAGVCRRLTRSLCCAGCVSCGGLAACYACFWKTSFQLVSRVLWVSCLSPCVLPSSGWCCLACLLGMSARHISCTDGPFWLWLFPAVRLGAVGSCGWPSARLYRWWLLLFMLTL